MISEQVSYEGNGQRRGEEVAFDQAEVHDKEEKCKIWYLTFLFFIKCNFFPSSYTRVTIQITGKKTLHNTDQNPKLEE